MFAIMHICCKHTTTVEWDEAAVCDIEDVGKEQETK